MAKAVEDVKVVKAIDGITLTLTPIEAIVLRALVGSVAGSRAVGYGNHYTCAIYDALTSAGVPTINYGVVVKETIKFTDDAMDSVQSMLDGWKPKT